MKTTSRPSTSKKIPRRKIDTKTKLVRIPSAFGDFGATGAKPPLSARATGAIAAAARSSSPAIKRALARTDCHSMNVSEGAYRGTRVRLPGDVVRPFQVFINGIQQTEGTDFRIDGRTLVFDRELKTEGKLGFWRWTSMWVGIAGTYRQNDSVDAAYPRAGEPVVATKLPLEPL